MCIIHKVLRCLIRAVMMCMDACRMQRTCCASETDVRRTLGLADAQAQVELLHVRLQLAAHPKLAVWVCLQPQHANCVVIFHVVTHKLICCYCTLRSMHNGRASLGINKPAERSRCCTTGE